MGRQILTFLEGALHVLDGVLGHLELQGVCAEEAGHPLHQQGVHLGLAGLHLLGQLHLVEGPAHRDLVGLHQGNALGQPHIAVLGVEVVQGALLLGFDWGLGSGFRLGDWALWLRYLHAQDHRALAAVLDHLEGAGQQAVRFRGSRRRGGDQRKQAHKLEHGCKLGISLYVISHKHLSLARSFDILPLPGNFVCLHLIECTALDWRVRSVGQKATGKLWLEDARGSSFIPGQQSGGSVGQQRRQRCRCRVSALQWSEPT